MEDRFQRLFLTRLNPVCRALAAMLVLGLGPLGAAPAFSATDPDELELEPLVVREPEVRQVKIDEIDTEDFEIGVFGGLMSVQDFGTDTLVGVRAAYHITEDFFVEGTYGQSTLGLTSFERLSGGARLLTEEERDLTYYNVSVGWNLFPGESFLARRWAFRGGLYLVGGVGSTEFGGDSRFTINAGVGYRLIVRDWLAAHVTVRNHMFDSELLGEAETLNNIEFSGAITLFF
ncbi:MAG: outer membrane beta-barrel domain-containing protein [Pseudomonadota bacterium]